MAIETYTEQLERVQAAIAAIEERGQMVTAEGLTLTRASLDQLYKREERLRKLVDRENRGGIRVRRVTPVDG